MLSPLSPLRYPRSPHFIRYLSPHISPIQKKTSHFSFEIPANQVRLPALPSWKKIPSCSPTRSIWPSSGARMTCCASYFAKTSTRTRKAGYRTRTTCPSRGRGPPPCRRGGPGACFAPPARKILAATSPQVGKVGAFFREIRAATCPPNRPGACPRRHAGTACGLRRVPGRSRGNLRVRPL